MKNIIFFPGIKWFYRLYFPGWINFRFSIVVQLYKNFAQESLSGTLDALTVFDYFCNSKSRYEH